MELLAGDIGGTNTRLAVYRTVGNNRFEALAEETFPSRRFEGLAAIVAGFISGLDLHLQRACFGVAGPVIDQTCDATNLPWRLSAQRIKEQFDFAQTWLLNDLEANAWGIGALNEDDLYPLNAGQGASGNASIISAGTGLGEAGLYWDGTLHRPFASEGGHSDFSPGNRLEFELYETLAEQYGRVSWERLVSGPGLEAIHGFLRAYRATPTPDWLARQMREKGIGPTVSAIALEQRDPICEEALDIFTRLYAREAANHALKIMATGGVYLGGGIAPQILERLKQPDFIQTFFDKGRMRPLMEAMPVKVILNDKAALLGAARYAAMQ
ncbi:MAG: glucokinase [Pseudomonadota bacterium]